MEKKFIKSLKAPAAVGPYEQGVVYNGILYCSGQIPFTPDGIMIKGDIKEECRQCLDNLTAICTEAGTDFNQALKITVYLTDMEHFWDVNEIYSEYFALSKPARTCVAVVSLPKNARIEIDGIFAVPKVDS